MTDVHLFRTTLIIRYPRNGGSSLLVSVTDILRQAPLLAAGAWFLLAILQVYRDRWHTWTEAFFLGACFFAGSYALCDWFFFTARSDASAFVYALASLTTLTLAALFVLLFTIVYIDRMRRWYWLFAGVTVALIPLEWIFAIDHVKAPDNPDALYVALFSPIPFYIFLVYLLVYAGAGIWNLIRLYRIVRKISRDVSRRAAGLVVTFTLTLVLGLVTNGWLGATGNSVIPPPFSTLLGLVAANAYYTLYPAGRQRIADAIRRFQSGRYSIKAAFITFEDGTLIGAKIRPGEKVIDQDLFGATLDVIQNYMKTSVPILRGKSLSSITHGHYVLVLERARFTYLTVVLEGEETDQLRRQMRDLLLGFESNNRQVLSAWQGIPDEAKGIEDVFTSIFVESPVA
jgi:hypothetical protein